MNFSEIDTPLYDCQAESWISGRTLHNYECQHATLAEAAAHAARLRNSSERGRRVVVRRSDTGERL